MESGIAKWQHMHQTCDINSPDLFHGTAFNILVIALVAIVVSYMLLLCTLYILDR